MPLLAVLGFFIVLGMALWLWKGAADYAIATERHPNDDAMANGGLRRRRGARRRDEGRS